MFAITPAISTSKTTVTLLSVPDVAQLLQWLKHLTLFYLIDKNKCK